MNVVLVQIDTMIYCGICHSLTLTMVTKSSGGRPSLGLGSGRVDTQCNTRCSFYIYTYTLTVYFAVYIFMNWFDVYRCQKGTGSNKTQLKLYVLLIEYSEPARQTERERERERERGGGGGGERGGTDTNTQNTYMNILK